MLHALDLKTRQILWSFVRSEDKCSWSFHLINPFRQWPVGRPL